MIGTLRPANLWSDRLWPLLAGVLTAVGVIGTHATYGALGLVLLPAVLWLLVSLMVWGAFSDSGVDTARALRYGVLSAHSFVTAIGVLILFPVAGWAAIALWGLTSPPVTERLGRRRAARSLVGTPATVTVPRGEQARVDRAFSDIVRGFHESA